MKPEITINALPPTVPTTTAPFHPTATHIDVLGMPVAFCEATECVRPATAEEISDPDEETLPLDEALTFAEEIARRDGMPMYDYSSGECCPECGAQLERLVSDVDGSEAFMCEEHGCMREIAGDRTSAGDRTILVHLNVTVPAGNPATVEQIERWVDVFTIALEDDVDRITNEETPPPPVDVQVALAEEI